MRLRTPFLYGVPLLSGLPCALLKKKSQNSNSDSLGGYFVLFYLKIDVGKQNLEFAKKAKFVVIKFLL